MYAYITGIVAEKSHNELVIEAGGIGYQLICSMNTVQNAPSPGESMRVYTYLNVHQDGMELFGFESREEREMFLRLIGVNGIGARTAVAILGSMPLRDLTLAILMGDTTTLCRAPGIGKKTAQRIALELKEKITDDEVNALPAGTASAAQAALRRDDPMAEAMIALQSLGYSQGEAMQALAAVKDKSDQSDELVRLALRSMM